MSKAADPAVRIAAAEHEAAAARDRASHTLGLLQDRLSPRQIARRTMRDASERSNEALETARQYPGAAIGLVALAGLFLGRHRIAALFRRKPKAADESPIDAN